MDNESMIKEILATVRSDPALWPSGYSKQDAETYLSVIEELVSPALNSRGFPIEEADYRKAKAWAEQVLDIYIQKNPFQGAFVKPLALGIFETLESLWKKRAQNRNDSWS